MVKTKGAIYFFILIVVAGGFVVFAGFFRPNVTELSNREARLDSCACLISGEPFGNARNGWVVHAKALRATVNEQGRLGRVFIDSEVRDVAISILSDAALLRFPNQCAGRVLTLQLREQKDDSRGLDIALTELDGRVLVTQTIRKTAYFPIQHFDFARMETTTDLSEFLKNPYIRVSH